MINNKADDKKLLDEVDEMQELKEKLTFCEKERDEYLDGWRRTKADLVNYKALETERLEEMVKYGNSEIIKDMINILLSFDLAIQNTEDKNSKDGIMRIRNQLDDKLKRYGLQKINVKVGDKFDPQFHEVLMQDESSSEPEVILEELSCGYTLHGKVIKTAKVKVTK